jgi:branched-chain amino acid transport system ATP-binding protein
MNSSALLSVRGLRSGYGAVEVLRGVDLDVAAGEIVALLGSNGAGKSTFNQTVSAVVAARAGSVQFDGRDITRAHYRDVVGLGLIHVPEGRRIFPNLSVLENLELGSFARARANRSANLERVFAIFPRLKEHTGQLAGTMSGGEQQMLAIGRGLMGEPRLLILDEPSLGLSPLLVKENFNIIRQINERGITVFLVEQNMHQTLAISHYGYVLSKGRVVASGTPAELAGRQEVRDAYFA